MEKTNTPSTRTLILQLIGYVLIFVIPTIVAAILLPEYTFYIMLIGLYLFLVVTSFLAGWDWNNLRLTTKDKTTLKIILLDSLLLLIAAGVIDIVKRIIKSDGNMYPSISMHIFLLAAIPAAILLPFYLARAIHRRSAHQCPHNTTNE